MNHPATTVLGPCMYNKQQQAGIAVVQNILATGPLAAPMVYLSPRIPYMPPPPSNSVRSNLDVLHVSRPIRPQKGGSGMDQGVPCRTKRSQDTGTWYRGGPPTIQGGRAEKDTICIHSPMHQASDIRVADQQGTVSFSEHQSGCTEDTGKQKTQIYHEPETTE